MWIFRIEHRQIKFENNFVGPYFYDYQTWTSRDHSELPIPSQDPFLAPELARFPEWSGYFFCGFNNLQQLRRWFTPEELLNLHREGYVLTLYRSTDVLVGQTQTLFRRFGDERQVFDLQAFVESDDDSLFLPRDS